MIGGYLGDKGGKMINSWIEKRHVKKIITYLHKEQVDSCCWHDTPEFFEMLEIKEEEFRE